MVKTPDQAAEAYRRGIEGFGGADTYKNCGKRKGEGFLAVAKCLEDAKEVKLTTELMVKFKPDFGWT